MRRMSISLGPEDLMGYLPPVTRPGPSDLARRRTVSTSFEQAREDRGHLQVRGRWRMRDMRE